MDVFNDRKERKEVSTKHVSKSFLNKPPKLRKYKTFRITSDDEEDEFSRLEVDSFKSNGSEAMRRIKRKYLSKINRVNQKKQQEIQSKERIDRIVNFIIYVFSNIINIISILNYILQTYFDQSKEESLLLISSALQVVEVATSLYFCFEYLLVLTRHKGSLLKHVFSFDSFIDLITIVPSIVTFLMTLNGSLTQMNFIKVFRVFRVFRILRLYKSFRLIQYEPSGNDYGAKGRSDPIKLQLLRIFVILICNFFICSGLVLGVQEILTGSFSKSDMNFFDALYFVVITCSTTGYGDVIPTHPVTRFFVILMLFSLVGIISHQVSKLVNLLNIWGPGLPEFRGRAHIILICDATVNLEAFLIKIRQKHPEKDVVVISSDLKTLPSGEYPFNKLILMTTSSIDLEVLEKANTKEAECIFIFSTKTVHDCSSKEKVVDFLILKINSYYSHVTIFVQSLYSDRSYNMFNAAAPDHNNFLMKQPSFSSASKMVKGSKKNILKYEKVIPILRLKSLIISKVMYNPGFAAFSQNLLFNDMECPEDFDSYHPLMQAYFLGCQNKICIRPMPHFFFRKEFRECVMLIYSRSITEFYSKVVTNDNRDSHRPILLIGVVEKRVGKEEVIIFPEEYFMKTWTLGVFISYDGGNYLNKVLDRFNDQKEVAELEKCLFVDFVDFKSRRTAVFEKGTGFSTKRNAFTGLNYLKDEVNEPKKRRRGPLPSFSIKIMEREDEYFGDEPLETHNNLISCKESQKESQEELEKVVFREIKTEHNQLKAHNTRVSFQKPLDILTLNKFNHENYNTKRSSISTENYITSVEKKPITAIHCQEDTENKLTLNSRKASNEEALTESPNYFLLKRRKKSISIDESLSIFDSFRKSNLKEESHDSDLDYELERREKFLRKRSIILRGDNTFVNQCTRKNIMFLQAIEDKNIDILSKKIEEETAKRYTKYDFFNSASNSEYFIENRIHDVEKNNISEFISDHILIVGYQDNLAKLIKLISSHNLDRELCIMLPNDFDDTLIYKLLKQFKFLIYLKGEAQNPLHLLNAGVQRAYYVLFLVDNIFTKTNEDMNKILAFKSIDYFFNTEMLLELWDKKSTRLIGYQPLNKNTNIVQNEFLHPQFMAGQILYMSHLEKITAISYTQEYVAEVFIEMLSMGFKTETSHNFNKTKGRKGFPVIVTIDIPESYVGKEYYLLTADLLSLDNMVMPLGLYVQNPLLYMKEKSQGRVSKFTRIHNANLKISTSYKKKILNADLFDKIEQGYVDNLKILRDFSYNDKVVLDYCDIKKPHLPIFITSPPPGFILNKECKLLVMHHYTPKRMGLKDFQQLLIEKRDKKLQKFSAMNTMNVAVKRSLSNSQDNFLYYVNSLKDKIMDQYTDAFKILVKNKE